MTFLGLNSHTKVGNPKKNSRKSGISVYLLVWIWDGYGYVYVYVYVYVYGYEYGYGYGYGLRRENVYLPVCGFTAGGRGFLSDQGELPTQGVSVRLIQAAGTFVTLTAVQQLLILKIYMKLDEGIHKNTLHLHVMISECIVQFT